MNKKFGFLLDIVKIKKETPNLDALKVTLKKSPVKGNGLYATKPIKKGNIIAYYKMKCYNADSKNRGPFGATYLFTVYTKKGTESKTLIGNLYEDSIPPPSRNIPFWAYFSNEPAAGQIANSTININTAGNYRRRAKLNVGDSIVYKLVATRNISPGEEIVWCYGDNYNRSYPVAPACA